MHIAIDNPMLDGQPQRFCCIGDAVYGPGRCTCWTYEHDQPQTEPIDWLEPTTRTRMCEDCAFRPDSPERQGDDRYEHAGDIDSLLEPGRTFWCHQGTRRKTAMVHPDGTRIEIDVDAYQPPIVAGVPYRTDGTPAERCAGWAARTEEPTR